MYAVKSPPIYSTSSLKMNLPEESRFNNERPHNWRLQKARNRQFSKSMMNLVDLEFQSDDSESAKISPQRDEETERAIDETVVYMESNGAPRIPLPPLPGAGNGHRTHDDDDLDENDDNNGNGNGNGGVPIEAMVRSVLEKTKESITQDYQNLKKVRRSPKRSISIPIPPITQAHHSAQGLSKEEEKNKALRRHSRALSVLSNCSSSGSRRSSMMSVSNSTMGASDTRGSYMSTSSQ